MSLKKYLLLSAFLVSSCSQLPGPSVPMQEGENLVSARAAVNACIPAAQRGGQNTVIAGYVTSVVVAGIILGPIVVASNERSIRTNGQYGGIDRCLANRGFERRELTQSELNTLNGFTVRERSLLLDHLIGGGTLDTYNHS